jgi:uncharacterized membrane-anchored protein YhcB (DUF1043 family)
MGKAIIKTAGRAAIESTLEQLLPTIVKRLDALQQELIDLRKHMDKKFEVVDERFERTREVINELGLRVNSVGVKVDTFMEFVHRNATKVDIVLERLVRVEEEQKHRRRRAG